MNSVLKISALVFLVFLTGCMSPAQKLSLALEVEDTEQQVADEGSEMVTAAAPVVMCGLDPTTMKPLPGANCTGLYVKFGVSDAQMAAITRAITPDTPVGAAEATRDIGMALVSGVFAPTTALTALGIFAIDKAGTETKSSYNTGDTATTSSDQRTSSRSNSVRTTDVSVNDSFSADGSNNTAGDDQQIADDSVTDDMPINNMPPDPEPLIALPDFSPEPEI